MKMLLHMHTISSLMMMKIWNWWKKPFCALHGLPYAMSWTHNIGSAFSEDLPCAIGPGNTVYGFWIGVNKGQFIQYTQKRLFHAFNRTMLWEVLQTILHGSEPPTLLWIRFHQEIATCPFYRAENTYKVEKLEILKIDLPSYRYVLTIAGRVEVLFPLE